MNTYLFIAIIVVSCFLYLVIGAIIDGFMDIGPGGIVFWPLMLFVMAAGWIGYTLADFIKDWRWKRMTGGKKND